MNARVFLIGPPGTPIPFDDWPEADRNAWHQVTLSSDIFSDAGAGAHWRPSTRKSYQEHYGRYLAFLAQCAELRMSESPALRFTRPRIVAYAEALQERLKPVSVWSYISDLHNTVHRMAPDEDWRWLRDVVNRLRLRFEVGTVTADQLRPIDEIYQAGFDLMDRAEKERENPRRLGHDSVHYRDGLMLSMLAATLLRAGNFSSLRIGTHLQRHEEGYTVTVPGHAVKNGQPFEGDLPISLTTGLDRYLDHHRPRLLMGTPTDRLWLSLGGAPTSSTRVSQRITKLTMRHLGTAISAHRFRHCAATSIATASPELARIIRPLLGHTKNDTGERYYNRATMMDASRRQANVIDQLRARLQRELANEDIVA